MWGAGLGMCMLSEVEWQHHQDRQGKWRGKGDLAETHLGEAVVGAAVAAVGAGGKGQQGEAAPLDRKGHRN